MSSPFIRSFASLGAGTLVLNAGRFVSLLFSARYVTPEELGSYFLLLLVAGIIVTIAGCGTGTGLVKFLGEEPDEAGRQRLVFTSVNFFVAVLLAVLGVALAANRFAGFMAVTPLAVLFVISQALLQFCMTLVQGLREFRLLAWANVSSGLLKAALVPALFLAGGEGTGPLIIAMSASNLAPLALLLYRLYSRSTPAQFAILDTAKLREVLGFSFPLYLNELYSIFYDRGYALLIAIMLNPAALAYYTIATRLPSMVEDFRRVYTSVFYPTILGMLKRNVREAGEFLNLSISAAFTVILPGAALFYFVREEAVVLFFSARYREVAFAAFLMLARCVFTFSGPLMGNTLIAVGHNHAPFRINFLVTTLTFVSTFLVIPSHGYLGVVWVAMGGELLGFILNVVYLRYAGIPLHWQGVAPVLLLFALTIGSAHADHIILMAEFAACFAALAAFRSVSIFRRYRLMHA